MLFELVIWTVDKGKVTGYVSTPKNAPRTDHRRPVGLFCLPGGHVLLIIVLRTVTI